jgi:hypothetical protein
VTTGRCSICTRGGRQRQGGAASTASYGALRLLDSRGASGGRPHGKRALGGVGRPAHGGAMPNDGEAGGWGIGRRCRYAREGGEQGSGGSMRRRG